MLQSFALQKAVVSTLTAALAELDPPVPVLDAAPENQPFPFVEISRWIEHPENLLATDMSRYQLALTVYSAYRGQKEVLGILDVIRGSLDGRSLATEEGAVVRVDLVRADTARDQDGLTFTGTALYDVLVER